MANYRVSTNTNNRNKTTQDKTNNKNYNKRNNKTKKDGSAKAFLTQIYLLKTSVDLQTVLAAERQLAEGQWLKEQLNVVKLRMFRVGTRMPTVSRTYGHCLVPLKTFIKNSASK
jgi:hypothetical protein